MSIFIEYFFAIILSITAFPVLALELEEVITVAVRKDSFSLMSSYTKDYHFDFYESKSDQSITLYVPKPLNGCVEKYTIPRKNGKTIETAEISPVVVAGLCPSVKDQLRSLTSYVPPRLPVKMYWVSLYGERSMIGFDLTGTGEHEWQFLMTSPDSDDISPFSNLVFSPRIYSFFVDTDLSLICSEPSGKRIVRLGRDSEQVTVVAQLDRSPMNLGPGPLNNQIVYSNFYPAHGPNHHLRQWFLKDLNSTDPMVPDVDLVQYFGHVMPGDLGSEAIPESVISVNFDNSFHDLNVAVVTYLQMGAGGTSSVYFVVYHGPKGNISFSNPIIWSKLEAINLPLVENCIRCVYTNVVTPLISEIVVKDGVLMVALGNSVKETLTFFKFDYGAHMPFRVVAVTSVLRDLPLVDKSFAKAMGFVAETTVNGEPLAPKLQEVRHRGNPHYDEMEKALFEKQWE
jgi:hypothetical protein